MSAVRLDGDVALVTGAGRGLGRAYALMLAERGAHVIVNDVGAGADGSGAAAAPAAAVAAEIRAAGGSATPSTHDITDPDQARAMVDAALSHAGRIDAIVHNAGILRDRTLPKLQADDVEAVLAVHLKAAFWTLIPAVPHMRKAGHGRIVLTASASGLFGTFGQSNYAAAKMGLVGLMRVLSAEGARDNILVNTIAPSARTRMTEELLGPLADKLAPEHVAPLVTWLCSRACTVGNQIFSAGGGRYARVFVGLTPGWTKPGPAVATPEEIAEHIGEITATGDFTVPDSGLDELNIMMAALSARGDGSDELS